MRLPIGSGVAVLLALAAFPMGGAAHEIPNDVLARVYVRPAGDRLSVLVRVPLEAMHDIEWPTRGPGYLDVETATPQLADAARVWIADPMEIRADGKRLDRANIVRARVSIPSDPSFASYGEALDHLRSSPPVSEKNLFWRQALLDVELAFTIPPETRHLAMRPGFERLGLRVATIVGYLSADGAEHVFRFEGDPGLVDLNPSVFGASRTFVRLGFDHILGGLDHLLFLLCLVIPMRRVRSLVLVVTAFTAAHSITLIAAALGFAPRALWFPPFVETIIATSIVVMAIGNVIRPAYGGRWLVAFAFGLVHGFGFAFALSDTLELAGRHVPAALAAFNVGVELGQLAVLAVVLPVLWTFLKLASSERIGTIVVSVLAGHVAWHWMMDRAGDLAAYTGWNPGLVSSTFADWALIAVTAGLGSVALAARRGARRDEGTYG